jgi:hypothetical protein
LNWVKRESKERIKPTNGLVRQQKSERYQNKGKTTYKKECIAKKRHTPQKER